MIRIETPQGAGSRKAGAIYGDPKLAGEPLDPPVVGTDELATKVEDLPGEVCDMWSSCMTSTLCGKAVRSTIAQGDSASHAACVLSDAASDATSGTASDAPRERPFPAAGTEPATGPGRPAPSGAAGVAVQNFNLMGQFDETTGLAG
jgi:hypothetical protein